MLFQTTTSRLNTMKTRFHFPGKRAFLRRNSMFAVPVDPDRRPSDRLVEGLLRAVEKGGVRPGGLFPTPERLAALTGEPLPECLEATGKLLELGIVKQRLSGQLLVSEEDIPPGY